MREPATKAAVEAIWRIESARVVAVVARMVGDLDLAEDIAQDALVAALERWPAAGVPDRPGAWLTATAKNRAIDILRRGRRLRSREEEMARDLAIQLAMDRSDLADRLGEVGGGVGDELLGLMFACCHPLLATEARVALTLRLLGGLETEEIARAFLVSKPTVAQRIVRAKRSLAEAGADFSVPIGDELERRLPDVLEVVYLIFNEGYAATAGEEWLRRDLCDEALRLGRILAELAPGEPEVHGLAALMEIQASRAAARVGPGGEAVLLPDQDRGRWDMLLVRRGLAALARAQRAGGAPGPYRLQAEIAACHARAPSADATDWVRIAALYEALCRLTPSPVAELNRAVAVGMAFGAEAGLRLADALAASDELSGYHLLHSVRGEMLDRLGRASAASAEFERAAALTENARERELLGRRAGEAAAGQPAR